MKWALLLFWKKKYLNIQVNIQVGTFALLEKVFFNIVVKKDTVTFAFLKFFETMVNERRGRFDFIEYGCGTMVKYGMTILLF